MSDDTNRTSAGLTLDIDLERLFRRVVHLCLLGIALCVVVDYFFNFADWVTDRSIRRLFNVAREGSIPSWFSSTLLLLAGVSCGLVVVALRTRGARFVSWIGWAATGAFFAFMGVDDAATIHERLGSWVERTFESHPDPSAHVEALMAVPTYTWQIFVAPLFALAGVAMTAYLFSHLRKHGQFRYLLLGMACFAMAVAIDFVEGMEGAYEDAATVWGLEDYTVSHYARVVEETLEMIGAVACLSAFLGYLAGISAGGSVTFGRGPATRADDRRTPEAERLLVAARSVAELPAEAAVGAG